MRPSHIFLSQEVASPEVLRLLEQYGFQDPPRAEEHLKQLAAKVGEHPSLDSLAEPLLLALSQTADPDSALVHLLTFLESDSAGGGLLADLVEHAQAFAILIPILGASAYLSQILSQHPEYARWLAEPGCLEHVKARSYFERQVEQALQAGGSREGLEALRRLRRRETLRVGAQDLLASVPLAGVVEQLSDLAEAILEGTFQLLAPDFLPGASGFAVLALGKLGGRELNFSSDIDLLYLYEDACPAPQALRFAREYTRALEEYTRWGRLYRVDLRLRPMGGSGEIAYPLKACRHYYRNWADTADRLALIKCRFVAGDRALGESFLELAAGAVYKRYLDVAAVEEVRWLKRRIDREVRRRGRRGDIKLDAGGIREIEFFVQAFQLLYGGPNPALRHTSTLPTLDRLVDEGFISLEDQQRLRQAYLFLRRLEHKLQLVYDRQEHTLPSERLELERCARRMGYRPRSGESASDQLLEVLERHLGHVQQAFHSLFESQNKPVALEELVLNPELERRETLRRLEQEGVPNPEEFLQGMEFLKRAPAFPHSPARLQNLLANLVPRLVEGARLSAHPRPLLARLDRFCQALGSRAGLYAELVENPLFCRRLLTILAVSEYLSETLIRNTELVDSIGELVRPAVDGAALAKSLARATAPAKPLVCRFRRREEFKAALYDLFSPASDDPRSWLSALAETCLAWAAGRVSARLDLDPSSFLLLSLGRLAGEELTYHSDLDILLLYRAGSGPSDGLYERLARELRRELEEHTEEGFLYRIDFRLRPEGQHGPLAVPLERFLAYFQQRADPWEKLAFARVRPLSPAGAWPELEDFCPCRGFSRREMAQLEQVRRRKEVEIGREETSGDFDFKVGRGGLLEIQFVVQCLLLEAGIHQPNIRRGLEILGRRDLLEEDQVLTLQRALGRLQRLESLQRLLSERSLTRLSRQPQENRVLARLLGYPGGHELLEDYLELRESVRAVYREFFPG